MAEDRSARTGGEESGADTGPAWRLADAAWGRSHAAPRAPRPLVGAAAVCAGLALVGAFGPWVRVSGRSEPVETVRGVQTDGVVVAVAAVAALVALAAL